MSSTKPIKLYNHAQGPNPWKVVMILEELKVPYESEFVAFDKLKTEPFISVNPNGRLPAIEDPNTGIKVWETGAIIDYVLETYDKENTLSYTTPQEKWDQRAWADFQKSGQGPYFGQLAWFKFFHVEKNLTSVHERFAKEIKRVIGVIDAHLKKHNRPYLVGDKVCYADLMFVTWNNVALSVMDPGFPEEFKETMPHAYEWHQALLGREAVKRALAAKEEATKNAGGH